MALNPQKINALQFMPKNFLINLHWGKFLKYKFKSMHFNENTFFFKNRMFIGCRNAWNVILGTRQLLEIFNGWLQSRGVKLHFYTLNLFTPCPYCTSVYCLVSPILYPYPKSTNTPLGVV